MKPILFNTEMVRALLEGRKTVTRRVVKGVENDWEFLQTEWNPAMTKVDRNGEEYPQEVEGFWATFEWDGLPEFPLIKAPYQPGDNLYVREAWQQNYDGSYSYRAKDMFEGEKGWRPSIHMPKEAARLFLRVTDVRVERLQNITMTGMLAEGVIPKNVTGGQWQHWQNDYMKPTWDSTVKPKDRDKYGWAANPWAWVIEFERISKAEALAEEASG